MTNDWVVVTEERWMSYFDAAKGKVTLKVNDNPDKDFPLKNTKGLVLDSETGAEIAMFTARKDINGLGVTVFYLHCSKVQ